MIKGAYNMYLSKLCIYKKNLYIIFYSHLIHLFFFTNYLSMMMFLSISYLIRGKANADRSHICIDDTGTQSTSGHQGGVKGSQGRLTRGSGGHPPPAHMENSHNHHSHIRNREAPLQRTAVHSRFRFLSHGGFYHSQCLPAKFKYQCLINRDETPTDWDGCGLFVTQESRRIPRLRYATVQCRLRATFPLISYHPPSTCRQQG
jgi:hypothetical protein